MQVRVEYPNLGDGAVEIPGIGVFSNGVYEVEDEKIRTYVLLGGFVPESVTVEYDEEGYATVTGELVFDGESEHAPVEEVDEVPLGLEPNEVIESQPLPPSEKSDVEKSSDETEGGDE